jgi:excinuclease UvrABC nuclease subunit
VKRIPSKVLGVYGFVVRPGMAENDYLGYLLYIGKTASQGGFKARYRQYLRHKAEARTRRPSIRAMLELWPDHLWFCYAEVVKERLGFVESSLIEAFQPPYNRVFPGKIGQARRAWA